MSVHATVLPASAQEIALVARRCRVMVRRRALASAGASLVPLPGVDIAADIGLLVRLIARINEEFGLAPGQIEQLEPRVKLLLYQALVGFGGAMVGKVVSADLVCRALRVVGTRITLRQSARFVPIAGQALSAALSFGAMTYVGDRHVRDCVAVMERLIMPGEWPRAHRVDTNFAR